MKKPLIIPLILLFALTAFSARAQVRDTDISLEINPAFPSPNQDVTASLSSQVLDLNKALITWSENGQQKQSGIGKKEFRFSSAGLGMPTTISASIDTVDGSNFIKSATVQPAEVDMLYEAPDAYVPPFYKGRALPASQSRIKVVAIPFLSSGPGNSSANFSYSWSQDGRNQPEGSGWGNSSYTFQNSYLDNGNTVSVQVSDIVSRSGAAGSIKINTINPKIIFYRLDPSLGTDWNQALQDGFNVSLDGESIVAAPYFFSKSDPDSPGLSYTWTLNGQKLNTPSPKNILSVKPESGTSGTAEIKLTINNLGTLFQSISKTLQVNF